MEKEGFKLELTKTGSKLARKSKSKQNESESGQQGGRRQYGVGEEMGLFRKMISGEKRVSMISF